MEFAICLLLLGFSITVTKCTLLSTLFLKGPHDEADNNIICNNRSLTLDFENTNLSLIRPSFIDDPLLPCLRLQGKEIHRISPLAFDKLPNLTLLELLNNNWDGQQMLSTGGHETLRGLNMDNVWSNTYDSDGNPDSSIIHINSSYPALEKLVFRDNRLHILEITVHKAAYFPKLSHLDLSNNRLRFILYNTTYTGSRTDYDYLNYRTDLSWLPKSLKYLNLDYNRLHSLSLTNMNELKFLSIYRNNLQNITLRNLNKLKVFSAEHNSIGPSVSDQFSSMPQIAFLGLSNNKISYFAGQIVDFMPKLWVLNLGWNLLTDVPVIKDAPNLQIYALLHNKISKLRFHDFIGMPNLKELDLSYNKIDAIDPNTFDHLEKLETLSLKRNKLVNLPAGWMLQFQNLRSVNLEWNKFTNLENLELNDSPSLVQFFLDDNPSELCDHQPLASVPKNISIDCPEITTD